MNVPALNISNILSLLSTADAPAASTNSSATAIQDFSAILTEMVGAPSSLPANPAAAATSAGTGTVTGAVPAQQNPAPGQALQSPQPQIPQPDPDALPPAQT